MTGTPEQRQRLDNSASKMLTDIETDCEVFLKSSSEEVEGLLFKKLEESIEAKGGEFVLVEFLKEKIAKLEEAEAHRLKLVKRLLDYTGGLHRASANVLHELVLVGVSHNLFEEENCKRMKEIFKNIDNRFVELNSLAPDNVNKLIKILSTQPNFKE